MIKKISLLLMVLIISGGLLFAGGRQEQAPETEMPEPAPAPTEEPAPQTPEPEPQQAPEPAVSKDDVTVNLAVFKGPTGFAYVQLIEQGENFVDGVSITTEVLPSPTEAVARLTSGEVDVAAMPVNLAASLYNRGVDVKLAAVTGEGMLYLMSSGSGSTLKSFSGKTVYIPGAGSSPDYVAQYVFEKSGLTPGKDVTFDYSINSAAQLAQMVVAGKVEHAVLPEPFATMTAIKGSSVRRAVDLQNSWMNLSGEGNYPMTALLIRGEFARNNPLAAKVIRMGTEDSIKWVNENPAEAAKLIEKYEILTAALAEPAIPNCNLIYTTALDARSDIEAYLSVLASFNPASIGGELPDEDFYLER